jgi:hypothetical protein
MSASKKPPAAQAGRKTLSVEEIGASIKAELEKIKAEEKLMVKNEAAILLNRVAVGVQLIDLKAAAKKDKKPWAEACKETGLHARVARRHMRVASSEWAKNGLNESDLSERLPTDLLKLELLAKLDGQQIRQLLKENDPKHLERSELIHIIKQVLNETKAPKTKPIAARIKERARRFTQQSLEDIARWKADGPDDTARKNCLDELSAMLGEVTSALRDEPAVSADDAPAGPVASN